MTNLVKELLWDSIGVDSRWRVNVVALVMVVSVPVLAVGWSQISKSEPAVQPTTRTATPSVAPTAPSGQPAGRRLVTSMYFSMDVPATFREASIPTPERGREMVAFDAPSSKRGLPVRVVVGSEMSRPGDSTEESLFATPATGTAGVKDLTRSTVKWPGAQSATLVQWTQKPADVDRQLRYRQVTARVNGYLVVSVLAFAPAKEFDKAGLAAITQSFRPHA